MRVYICDQYVVFDKLYFTQNVVKFRRLFQTILVASDLSYRTFFPFVCFFLTVHVLSNLLRMQNDKLDFDPVYLLYLIHKFGSI